MALRSTLLGKTPKLDSEDAEQLGMSEVVLTACRKRGIYPGVHWPEPAYAARMIRMGFRLIRSPTPTD